MCVGVEEKLRVKLHDRILGDKKTASATSGKNGNVSKRQKEKLHMLKDAFDFSHVKVRASRIGSVDSFYSDLMVFYS